MAVRTNSDYFVTETMYLHGGTNWIL